VTDTRSPLGPAPLAGAGAAFCRLYGREPTETELAYHRRVGEALGLDEGSEWWLFFYAVSEAASRVAAAADRIEHAIGRDTRSVADAGVDELTRALANHRRDIEQLAQNSAESLLEAKWVEAAAAAERRINIVETEAIARIVAAVEVALGRTDRSSGKTQPGRHDSAEEQGGPAVPAVGRVVGVVTWFAERSSELRRLAIALAAGVLGGVLLMALA
jgi:hypothetical protein